MTKLVKDASKFQKEPKFYYQNLHSIWHTFKKNLKEQNKILLEIRYFLNTLIVHTNQKEYY